VEKRAIEAIKLLIVILLYGITQENAAPRSLERGGNKSSARHRYRPDRCLGRVVLHPPPRELDCSRLMAAALNQGRTA
jgi:hypothetical protein